MVGDPVSWWLVARGIGDVQQGGSLLLGPLAPPVVAGGSLDACVPGELLGRGEVGSGVEQVPDEGAPHVVWREALRSYLPAEPPQDVVDRLVTHPPPLDFVALVDRIE